MAGHIDNFHKWNELYGVFVETGTYLGHTTKRAAKQFREVYTIELDKNVFESTRERLKSLVNVRWINGDSSRELELLCRSIREPAIFFLDAHYAGGPTARGAKEVPVNEELGHIASRNLPDLIIIDDYDLFGKAGTVGGSTAMYPVMQYDWTDITLEKCLGILREKGREFSCAVKDDRLFILLYSRRIPIAEMIGDADSYAETSRLIGLTYQEWQEAMSKKGAELRGALLASAKAEIAKVVERSKTLPMPQREMIARTLGAPPNPLPKGDKPGSTG